MAGQLCTYFESCMCGLTDVELTLDYELATSPAQLVSHLLAIEYNSIFPEKQTGLFGLEGN